MRRLKTFITKFCAIFVVFIYGMAMDSIVFADQALAPMYSSNSSIKNQKCNTFTFDASQSHLPNSQNISYFWDFGDGYTSVVPIATHTYSQSGDFSVYLTITDHSGFECSKAVTSKNVQVNIPPTANFISKNRSCVNRPLTFDASSSRADKNKKLNYFWNFGDGATLEGKQHVVKSFRKGGDFKVQLTVDDQSSSSCSTSTIEKIIHINEPPMADAGEDVILRCVNSPNDMTVEFNASKTTDANNDSLGFLWDFGDGHEQRGSEASHTFKETGNFDVKLIVSDDSNLKCGTSVDFVTVKLNQAPSADAGKDIVVCAGESVAFDGLNSKIQKKGTAVAQWFFGDGIHKRGLKVNHRYIHPGRYQATLTLENKLNIMCPVSRDTRIVTVNSAPIINIKSKTSECVGGEVFFDASSAADPDGDELIYYWNFGDGTSVNGGAKIKHRYAQGGHFRVSVIADDQKNTKCSSASAKHNVHINTPPIADAGANQTCCVNKKTIFSASASSDPDGDQLKYIWDFGDGTIKHGENVNHTYVQSGTYNVQLLVDDQTQSNCNQSTDGFVAQVKDTPQPVINIR